MFQIMERFAVFLGFHRVLVFSLPCFHRVRKGRKKKENRRDKRGREGEREIEKERERERERKNER